MMNLGVRAQAELRKSRSEKISSPIIEGIDDTPSVPVGLLKDSGKYVP